jgi:hypothetical protein
MLDIEKATKIPNSTALSWWFKDPITELSSISFVGTTPTRGSSGLVRVGCATTNEQFRLWCLEQNLVTLPLNVIMVEITLGGSNAPICHGAGRKHPTLSDLVRRIEYVDCNGELRSIDSKDKEFILAASGCFGLIGVVTHITLELEPISYAVMKPVKKSLIDAIPPPKDYYDRLPPALANILRSRTEEQMAEAQADFEKRAANDYYAEWFWFPFNDNVWVNTWNTVPVDSPDIDPSSVVPDWPSRPEVFLQFLEAVAMEGIQNIGSALDTSSVLPRLQTTIISASAMKALPSETTIVTPVPNALHFRRAIQNTRVRDVELEIPLRAKDGTTDVPDFDVVQRTWWDAILSVYDPRNIETCPQRMPLEMRIMGGSDVTMAPQRGNTLGTCAIEVLTLVECADIWPAYAQEVVDKWILAAGGVQGVSLPNLSNNNTDGKITTAYAQSSPNVHIRPHWAKEWAFLSVPLDGTKNSGRISFRDYIKQHAYRDAIPQFKAALDDIGHAHGWSRAEIKTRFSNELFDDLYFDDIARGDDDNGNGALGNGTTGTEQKGALPLPDLSKVKTLQEGKGTWRRILHALTDSWRKILGGLSCFGKR